jgi:hypothetical protein
MNKLMKSESRKLRDSDEDLSDDDDDEDIRGRKGRKGKEKKSKKNKKHGKKGRDSSESSSESSDSEDDYRSKIKDKKNRRRLSEDVVLKVPLYEECVIPCNKWFANDEDDGLCIRELQVRDKTMFYKN